MTRLDSLNEAITKTFGTKAAPTESNGAAESNGTRDFASFMNKKPIVESASVEQKTVAPTEKDETPAQEQAPAAPTTEPINYAGQEMYDVNALAETITGPLVENPSGLTDLIFGAIEWVRSAFYPGLLFRVMFTEKERDQLEDVLAKYIDIDLVGEGPDMIPLKKDMQPSSTEKSMLLKWKKFNKGIENLPYNEKEAATFKQVIHDHVKNLSIDHIIAKFGPYIGLIAMEAGKITPFIMNRKASLLNTYRKM